MSMLATPPDRVRELETELRRRHRFVVRNLRLVAGDNGVELYGEATTYHVKQLVIRDVLALGNVRILANRIAVD